MNNPTEISGTTYIHKITPALSGYAASGSVRGKGSHSHAPRVAGTTWFALLKAEALSRC